MRTIIAGSRRLHDPRDPTDETLIPLVAAAAVAAAWPISLVISGLARGPDQAAVRWAEVQGIPVQAMRPDWQPGLALTTARSSTLPHRSAGTSACGGWGKIGNPSSIGGAE